MIRRKNNEETTKQRASTPSAQDRSGTGSPSTGRKTQKSSAGKGGEGRTFSIRTTKNPTTLVSEARMVAKENDTIFRGDTNSGSFSGKGVKDSYRPVGRAVKGTVTASRPTLATSSAVETKVKEFFR